jgi:hypothetical protein
MAVREHPHHNILLYNRTSNNQLQNEPPDMSPTVRLYSFLDFYSSTPQNPLTVILGNDNVQIS